MGATPSSEAPASAPAAPETATRVAPQEDIRFLKSELALSVAIACIAVNLFAFVLGIVMVAVDKLDTGMGIYMIIAGIIGTVGALLPVAVVNVKGFFKWVIIASVATAFLLWLIQSVLQLAYILAGGSKDWGASGWVAQVIALILGLLLCALNGQLMVIELRIIQGARAQKFEDMSPCGRVAVVDLALTSVTLLFGAVQTSQMSDYNMDWGPWLVASASVGIVLMVAELGLVKDANDPIKGKIQYGLAAGSTILTLLWLTGAIIELVYMLDASNWEWQDWLMNILGFTGALTCFVVTLLLAVLQFRVAQDPLANAKSAPPGQAEMSPPVGQV